MLGRASVERPVLGRLVVSVLETYGPAVDGCSHTFSCSNRQLRVLTNPYPGPARCLHRMF